jgi:hypothetical protein
VLRQLSTVLQLTLVVDPNTTLVWDLLANPAPAIVRTRIPLRAEERGRPCGFGPRPDHGLSARHHRLALLNPDQTLRGTDCFRFCRRCGFITIGYDECRSD